MQPASTMKLVTTAVGLSSWGPSSRPHGIAHQRDVINGVLKGDLILRGGADRISMRTYSSTCCKPCARKAS